MSLSPKEMSEKIISNLKIKTGRNLEQWMLILDDCVFDLKKDKVKWLKDEHELGHYQAVTIVDMFINGGVSIYDNEEKLIDELFVAEHEKYRSLYEKISRYIKSLDENIKIKPCKTYIPFSNKRQFMIIKPHKEGLTLGFALGDDYKGELLKAKGIGGSDRINYMLLVKDFNESVKNIIEHAYQLN